MINNSFYKTLLFSILLISALLVSGEANAAWQDMTYVSGTNSNIDLEVKSSDINLSPNGNGQITVKTRLHLGQFDLSEIPANESRSMRIVSKKKTANGHFVPISSKTFPVQSNSQLLNFTVHINEVNNNTETYKFLIFDIDNDLAATFKQDFTAGAGVTVVQETNPFMNDMPGEAAEETLNMANHFGDFFSAVGDEDISEPELNYLGGGAYQLKIPTSSAGASDASNLDSGTLDDARLSSNVVLKDATQTLTNKTIDDLTITGSLTFTGNGVWTSDGDLGVGKRPGSKLDVDGLTTTQTIKITGGSPGAGKVLTSDASGNATWQAASGGGTDTGSTPPGNCNNSRSFAQWIDTDTGMMYICDTSNSRNKWLSIQDNSLLGEEDSSCYSGNTVNTGTCNVDLGDSVPYNVGVFLPNDITITGYAYSSQSDYCTSGSFDIEVWGTGSSSENENISHKATVASSLNNKAHNGTNLNIDVAGNQYIKWGLDNNCGQTITDFNIIIYYRWRHD